LCSQDAWLPASLALFLYQRKSYQHHFTQNVKFMHVVFGPFPPHVLVLPVLIQSYSILRVGQAHCKTFQVPSSWGTPVKVTFT